MKQLCFIIVMVGFLSRAFASSLVTPEYAEIGGVARAMKMYQTLNQGRLPTSWDQIRQVYDLDKVNQNLRYRQSYPLEDHYQFITQPMPFQSHGGVLSEGSQVLLLRTVPLENLSEPDENERMQWRYLIVRSKDGEITSTRLPEQDVQAMLKNAKVTITPKPSLPAVETDAVIPGREPKPQPNPNDAEFLKQHPELDPQKTGRRMREGVPPPSFPTSPEPIKPKPSAPMTTAKVPVEESGPDWFLILGVVAVALVSGAVAFRVWKKYPTDP